jgi:hypothetical protein
LGDSIFDNAAYTGGQPDVVTHLRRILPIGSTATLLAVDGSTTADVVAKQVPRLPRDTTQAAVSMGGNDALLEIDALDLPVTSTAEALTLFGERTARFRSNYQSTLAEILRRVPRVAVCTIYNPRLAPDEAALTRVGLALFNDVILSVAFELRVPVIDLRSLILQAEDFANPLEPSGRGGEKIARAIASALDLAPDGIAAPRVHVTLGDSG